MNLQELEVAVKQLPAAELTAFARWFEEFIADAWDRRIEADIAAGRLDAAARGADTDFEAGRCRPRSITLPRPESGIAIGDCHPEFVRLPTRTLLCSDKTRGIRR